MRPYYSPYIKMEDCKHGDVYLLVSRNLFFGVYNAEEKGFIGIRCKFGDRYLFTEYHWDTGEPFGTVCPVQRISSYPYSIDESSNELFEYLDTFKV